ncbi:23S rRNA methyltransferase [Cellvibrio zantedeschiae]|uniref:23S rRNA methyltransferase n=1 Tax=Cellvibrio zantedeschiae TaxID=1237077 RepID=A0ABQ3AVP7_9GAMM|nr:RNA methyltransferase [Cellvibrio zantedeschiae]GGY66002.1 23S rRNA methyltransferase [Cellvibrio zantedeschiae]
MTESVVAKPFAYIGLVNPKSPENVGMVMRAAGCYEASKIFYTGTRFDRARQFFTDTKNSHEKIPLKHTEDLVAVVPEGAKIVAVELVEGATPLMYFEHPEHAFYIFGPEDGSLSQSVLDKCDHVVYVPTVGCMNLAASVNVVLYDRLAKSVGSAIEDRSIAENRDTNSRGVVVRK